MEFLRVHGEPLSRYGALAEVASVARAVSVPVAVRVRRWIRISHIQYVGARRQRRLLGVGTASHAERRILRFLR